MKIRIHLSIDEAEAFPVIRGLSDIDALALVEPTSREDYHRHQLVETLEDQESRLDRLCRELGIEVERGVTLDSPDPAEDIEEAGELLEKLEEKLRRRWQNKRDLERKREHLTEVVDSLQWFESLGIRLPELSGSRYMVLRFGWIPADQLDRMKCPALRNPLLIIPLLQREKRMMIAAATVKASEYILQRVLGSLFFEAMELDNDVVRQAQREPEKQLKDLEKRIDDNDRSWQHTVEEWRGRLISLRQRIREDVKNVRLLEKYGRFEEGNFCHLLADIPENKSEEIFQKVRKTATRPYALFAGRPVVEVE